LSEALISFFTVHILEFVFVECIDPFTKVPEVLFGVVFLLIFFILFKDTPTEYSCRQKKEYFNIFNIEDKLLHDY
jgi:hypothetical protein